MNFIQLRSSFLVKKKKKILKVQFCGWFIWAYFTMKWGEGSQQDSKILYLTRVTFFQVRIKYSLQEVINTQRVYS